MPLDIKAEISKIRDYYDSDPLQQRFSALITGESGSGKTFIVRTCRKPIHIDSFDPGGTKCLRDYIRKGDIIADTRWEEEDPFNPKQFNRWIDETDKRLANGYFDHFGTYVLDSASSWGDAAMNSILKEAKRPGEAPRWAKDYVPQKVAMVNRIKRFMSLRCDFILTGHLKATEENFGSDKDGNPITRTRWRFLTTGQATVTIPMLFDELYVLIGKETATSVKRHLITDAQGEYVARSRLKADGVLNVYEEPDIKALLKKIGLSWNDKPSLNF